MKKLLRLRKEVSHGGIIPRGWKLAWYEPRRRIGVYCPAPLHWIFRAARECKRRVRLALRAPTIECAEVFEMQRRHRDREHLAAEYARGYFQGWHECFHVCLETVTFTEREGTILVTQNTIYQSARDRDRVLHYDMAEDIHESIERREQLLARLVPVS